jgi:hypothetical protein
MNEKDTEWYFKLCGIVIPLFIFALVLRRMYPNQDRSGGEATKAELSAAHSEVNNWVYMLGYARVEEHLMVRFEKQRTDLGRALESGDEVTGSRLLAKMDEMRDDAYGLLSQIPTERLLAEPLSISRTLKTENLGPNMEWLKEAGISLGQAAELAREEVTPEHAVKALEKAVQIEHAATQMFVGQLKFLDGWDASAALRAQWADFRKSGEPTAPSNPAYLAFMRDVADAFTARRAVLEHFAAMKKLESRFACVEKIPYQESKYKPLGKLYEAYEAAKKAAIPAELNDTDDHKSLVEKREKYTEAGEALMKKCISTLDNVLSKKTPSGRHNDNYEVAMNFYKELSKSSEQELSLLGVVSAIIANSTEELADIQKEGEALLQEKKSWIASGGPQEAMPLSKRQAMYNKKLHYYNMILCSASNKKIQRNMITTDEEINFYEKFSKSQSLIGLASTAVNQAKGQGKTLTDGQQEFDGIHREFQRKRKGNNFQDHYQLFDKLLASAEEILADDIKSVIDSIAEMASAGQEADSDQAQRLIEDTKLGLLQCLDLNSQATLLQTLMPAHIISASERSQGQQDALVKLYAAMSLDPDFQAAEDAQRDKMVRDMEPDRELMKQAQKSWPIMTPEQKLPFVNKIADRRCDSYGVKRYSSVEFFDIVDNYALGTVNSEYILQINKKCTDNFETMLSTVFYLSRQSSLWRFPNEEKAEADNLPTSAIVQAKVLDVSRRSAYLTAGGQISMEVFQTQPMESVAKQDGVKSTRKIMRMLMGIPAETRQQLSEAASAEKLMGVPEETRGQVSEAVSAGKEGPDEVAVELLALDALSKNETNRLRTLEGQILDVPGTWKKFLGDNEVEEDDDDNTKIEGVLASCKNAVESYEARITAFSEEMTRLSTRKESGPQDSAALLVSIAETKDIATGSFEEARARLSEQMTVLRNTMQELRTEAVKRLTRDDQFNLRVYLSAANTVDPNVIDFFKKNETKISKNKKKKRSEVERFIAAVQSRREGGRGVISDEKPSVIISNHFDREAPNLAPVYKKYLEKYASKLLMGHEDESAELSKVRDLAQKLQDLDEPDSTVVAWLVSLFLRGTPVDLLDKYHSAKGALRGAARHEKSYGDLDEDMKDAGFTKVLDEIRVATPMNEKLCDTAVITFLRLLKGNDAVPRDDALRAAREAALRVARDEYRMLANKKPDNEAERLLARGINDGAVTFTQTRTTAKRGVTLAGQAYKFSCLGGFVSLKYELHIHPDRANLHPAWKPTANPYEFVEGRAESAIAQELKSSLKI